MGDVLGRQLVTAKQAGRPGATGAELGQRGDANAAAQRVVERDPGHAPLVLRIGDVGAHGGSVAVVPIIEGVTSVPRTGRRIGQVTQSRGEKQAPPHVLPIATGEVSLGRELAHAFGDDRIRASAVPGYTGSTSGATEEDIASRGG
eukprot:CAMPEP_0179877086 /NCGR_PEP_ID=MMETSP0982-20121206/24611_1 /TAXON_ID=483367 /ORGANISM="non described non described, Strain CCMP 2436" /LENGTH=145 /DNA_ID=CAMNT_0021769679 /DNA_START=385 /DNA_END=823 /DNA_ORIENTATION=-